MKTKIQKWFTLCFVMGFVYLSIEVVVRAVGGHVVGQNGWSYASLVGWTSLWMIPIGGACGAVLGLFNERERGKEMKMVFQCLLGAVIILAIELVGGLICNRLFNFAIWDYSHLRFNLFGQICPQFGILWFFLAPFGFWLDDFLRHALYDEDSKYSIVEPYKKLFTFK